LFDRVEIDGRFRRDDVAAALGEEVAADVLQALRDEGLGELLADEVGDDAFAAGEFAVAQEIAGAIAVEAGRGRGDNLDDVVLRSRWRTGTLACPRCRRRGTGKSACPPLRIV
jgi:hypothetical protein